MKYFNDILGTTTYRGVEVVNIFDKLKFKHLKDTSRLIEYTIVDGDTPRILSSKLYGTPDYWWTILLTNNIQDIFFDFTIPTNVIDSIITTAIEDGIGKDDLELFIINNGKTRDIKVISPNYILSFMEYVNGVINK